MRIPVRKLQTVYKFVTGFVLGMSIVNVGQYIYSNENSLQCKGKTNIEKWPKGEEVHHTSQPDSLFFIGVMTARQYLSTRALAMNKSWVQSVSGRVMYFVGKGEKIESDLPVVVLDDVDDMAYPPVKKAFVMMKYMYEHFGDKYEWFMRADDDIYMRMDIIENNLRSANSSRLLYMGQSGVGAVSERSKLGLDGNRYCTGGTGMLFSRSSLAVVAKNYDYCLNSVYTTHEDTEIGRCVYQMGGIACTDQFPRRYYVNFKKLNSSVAFHLGPVMKNAIYIHPVKIPERVYKLHNYYIKLKVAEQLEKIESLKRMILFLNSLLGGEKYEEKHLHHVEKKILCDVPWDFMQRGSIFSTIDPHQNPKTDMKLRGQRIGLDNAMLAAQNIFFKNKTGHCYRRESCGQSLEHILCSPGRVTRTSCVRTRQPFLHAHFREGDKLDTNLRIHVILPLYQRPKPFVTFLTGMKKAVNNFGGTIDLRVILYHDKQGHYKTSLKNSKAARFQHKKLKISVVEVKEEFSRAKAFRYGLYNLANDSLILVIDVDHIFTADFLYRVCRNTILGKQIFFPIFFSQFDPVFRCHTTKMCNVSDFSFDQTNGLWRFFSYGIAALYMQDLLHIGNFPIQFKGWGSEDVVLYNQCLEKKTPVVFRSVDPSVVHIYHPKYCNPELEKAQLIACLDSRAAFMGSLETLSAKFRYYKITKSK